MLIHVILPWDLIISMSIFFNYNFLLQHVTIQNNLKTFHEKYSNQLVLFYQNHISYILMNFVLFHKKIVHLGKWNNPIFFSCGSNVF